MTLNRIKDEIDKRIDELSLKIKIMNDEISMAHYLKQTKREDKLIEKRRWLSAERSVLADMLSASKRF